MEEQSLPTPDFQVLISTFATQAAVALGQIQNPITNKTDVDLGQAKFAIDMLQVLEEKTQGNRTAEEDKYLQDLLYQFRMVYIDQSSKKS
ncbi:MAG: DUF1844 domain-containing protein [Planctomycetota bacterium]|jgi:hypothetical protein